MTMTRDASRRTPRAARSRRVMSALLCALLCMAHVDASEDEARATRARPGALHVASPDWRDQIIYFVMIDRFDDGDPGSNDQGAGEFDPADGRKYSGGDLAGITRRIDYIRGLGATAVWITPPVANQWWDASVNYGGYHGYWAENFIELDRHVGTLRDYRALSRALHGAGMYLVQDVVLNHTGNFFAYDDTRDANDPTRGYRLSGTQQKRHAPSQPPFDRNDPRRARDRAAAIYHWTPDIVDYAVPEQERNWQLAGLDDLNSESPLVRAALRRSYGHWIREAGIDAMRADTAFYIPPDAFADFLASDDRAAPGMVRVAAATGRDDFLVFGEGFALDRRYDDKQHRKIDAYMRGAAGDAGLSMINFPLYGTLGEVFARGRPTSELSYRLAATQRVHAAPHRMPTFIDNHDVARFLSGGSVDGMQQALLALMTLPGIPVIYYGTEQGFTAQRGAMFAKGVDSGGVDHFDRASALYRYVARVTALRRANRVFSRGTPTVVADSGAGAGVFAYRMRGDDGDALVVFNTADSPRLFDAQLGDLATGTVLKPMFAIGALPAAFAVRERGTLVHELPSRAGFVWRVSDETGTVAATPSLTLNTLPMTPGSEFLNMAGSAERTKDVRVVVDGDIAAAQPVQLDANGDWRMRIDLRALHDRVSHRVVAWSPATGAVSAARTFDIVHDRQHLATVDDPEGDDAGPRGSYQYPADDGWRAHRQMDLRQVRVERVGSALRIAIKMREITNGWNPPNGFDHVAFTLLIDLPGDDGGSAVLPMQNASLPDGMRWNYRLRAHGWSNAGFSAVGANASSDGTPVTPAADIEVDADANEVAFTIPAATLGNPTTFSGTRIYVATWDYDDRFRALRPEADKHALGGGDGTRDPLVMDSAYLEVP
jgi:glycosidase